MLTPKQAQDGRAKLARIRAKATALMLKENPNAKQVDKKFGKTTIKVWVNTDHPYRYYFDRVNV